MRDQASQEWRESLVRSHVAPGAEPANPANVSVRRPSRRKTPSRPHWSSRRRKAQARRVAIPHRTRGEPVPARIQEVSFQDVVPKHIQQIAPYKSENPAEEVERELGIKVVQLGMNENPFGPSPKAVEAVRGYLQNIAPYPDDSGYYLREKLAADFNISMDQIIVSSGSSDILAMAYHALFGPEVEVLTAEASFVVYYQLAEITGIRLIPAPMKDYGFDLEAMAG